MDIQTSWTSQEVDMLPIQPMMTAKATGFITGNLNNVVGGEVAIQTSGQVIYTTYNTPLSGTTIPLVRTIVLPR